MSTKTQTHWTCDMCGATASVEPDIPEGWDQLPPGWLGDGSRDYCSDKCHLTHFGILSAAQAAARRAHDEAVARLMAEALYGPARETK